MTEEKKNLFEKTIDALTNRDEKEAEAKAEAARKKGAELSEVLILPGPRPKAQFGQFQRIFPRCY